MNSNGMSMNESWYQREALRKVPGKKGKSCLTSKELVCLLDWLLVVLGIKSRALGMLRKPSTTKPQP